MSKKNENINFRKSAIFTVQSANTYSGVTRGRADAIHRRRYHITNSLNIIILSGSISCFISIVYYVIKNNLQ